MDAINPIQEPGPISVWDLLPDDQVICPSLAAHLCGVSVVTIYSWLKRGIVVSVSGPGRRQAVRLRDLERLTGKTFLRQDLIRAEYLRAEFLVRQERTRRVSR
jgi:hypothetical protein